MPSIMHITSNGWQEVSPANPLPVYQALPSGKSFITRSSYSGSVTYNSSATMHGGVAGTPTVVDVSHRRYVLVALQHRMATAAQTGNKLRVRRRYYAQDGTPYVTWTDYQDFTFDSTTSDQTKVFLIALSGDATSPIADEMEITIQNASTTSGNTLTWQAIVMVVS